MGHFWVEINTVNIHDLHGNSEIKEVTTYAEFLKMDFPRIPWPASPDEFWDISTKGTQLRKLHLMDPATVGPTPYLFKG